MFSVVFVLLCVLAWTVYLKFPKKRQPPSNPGGWLHNLYVFGFQNERLWKKIWKLTQECMQLGGITRFTADANYYIITDPDAIMAVSNSCLDKGIFYQFWKTWVGHGLLTADERVWKPHRKQLTPLFHQRVIDDFLATFNSQAQRLVMAISAEDRGKPFNPYPYLIVHHLDTLCLTSFGFTEDKETFYKYYKAMEEINITARDRFNKFWLHSDFVYMWTSLKQTDDKNLRVIHGTSSKLILRRRNELKKENQNGGVETNALNANTANRNIKLIDVLLEAQAEGIYTEKELREEVDTFFLAGADSMSTTIMYALVLLGSHPHVQQKVYDEIEEVLGPSKDVQKEDLTKLLYLEAVLKETIRLYPFAALVSRTISKNVTVKDYTLLAGSTLFLIYYGTHRLPIWGPDAEEFRPERWLNPSTVPTHPAAFCGFSWGRRSCIGKPYAVMALKVTMAHLLRALKVTADHTKLEFELDFVLKPVCGHHIAIERRFVK